MLNPVNSRLSCRYVTETGGNFAVSVYSITGIKVLTTSVTVSKETNWINMDALGSLRPAVYMLEIIHGKQREVIRFLKD